jgi:SSS family solute:Na+ symporter/sodium/proline symporter
MTGALAVVLVTYFAAVLALAVVGYRRTRTSADFIVAGRSLGALVGGATLAATQISAGTFVGTVGLHYLAGVCFAWVWPGAWLGWLVSAVFVAPRLRAAGVLTIPEYCERRFGSRGVRALAALLIIVAYSIYLVAQYKASGIIVSTVLGWPAWSGIALVLASTVVYSLAGGLHGGARIDLLQCLVMVVGLVGAVPYLLGHLGGVEALGRALAQIDPRLTGWYYGWRELVAFGAAFGLSLAATPLEATRFMAMRDAATARYAIGVGYIFQAVIGSAIMIIGLSMRALFPALPSADLASSVMAAHVLTPVAGSLLLVAAFSAIMSTVNAILLVGAASVAHDLYGRFWNPTAGDRARLAANRAAVLLLAVAPVWFAVREVTLVQFIVLAQANLIASAFFAPVVVGLNWRRGGAAAALSSMLVGTAACAIWNSIFLGVGASLTTFVAVAALSDRHA